MKGANRYSLTSLIAASLLLTSALNSSSIPTTINETTINSSHHMTTNTKTTTALWTNPVYIWSYLLDLLCCYYMVGYLERFDIS
jgi:hypothetical protein